MTVGVVVVAGGCAGGAPSHGAPARSIAAPPPPTRPPATPRPSVTTATTSPPTSHPPPTIAAPVEQTGWSVIAETPTRISSDTRTVAVADGAQVTLIRFRSGAYRLDLHLGGTDPPSAGLAVPALAGSSISASERPLLLGAFNGGFKSTADAGGFEADGRVVTGLVAGAASLVIDTDGAVRVGLWGQTVPAPGERVLSVRQNLRPLIHAGQVSPYVGDVGAWGATLGGVARVARSAVGLDAAGDLVYAASMLALPVDVAQAMQAAGVAEAMELDINPYWVQADVASQPGGPLSPGVPGQQRPGDQYLRGWTRDFVAVLAAP